MRSIHCALACALLLVTAAPVRGQCEPLSPADDGTGISVALILAEIAPGQHIILYNSTANDIALSATSYQLCSPFAYARLSTFAPSVVVPATGYATIDWPGNFTDVAGGGEVILYTDNLFNNSDHIMDFVCWGANPHATRKSQAEAVGKWSGLCNAALSNGAIRRQVGSTGTGAAAYDADATPTTDDCSPTSNPGRAPRVPLFSELSVAPNPFNPITQVSFRLRIDAAVRLSIFRADGRRLHTIDLGSLRAGEQSVRWDAIDAQGHRLPSGVYFAQIEAGGERAATKLVLVE